MKINLRRRSQAFLKNLPELCQSSLKRGPAILVAALWGMQLGSAHAEQFEITGQISSEPVTIRLSTDRRGQPAPSPVDSLDCLIVGDNGHSPNASRFAWGSGASGQPYCGFGSKAEQEANGQSMWYVHPVYMRSKYRFILYNILENKLTRKCLVDEPSGPRLVRLGENGPLCGASLSDIPAHFNALWTIDPAVPASSIISWENRCLIFSNRGLDLHTSLHNWGVDQYLFCGMDEEDRLNTRQATFKIAAPRN